MSYVTRAALLLTAAASGLGAASAAHAEYFVRPVLQYQGAFVDGLALNGVTSRSLTFFDGSTGHEAHVDLANGTIKTYLEMYGPNEVFGASSGVMGEQIRYTGAEDVPVSFSYDFHSEIFADQISTTSFADLTSMAVTVEDYRYIGIEAHFAIYEAGSGAYWSDWTEFGTHSDKALFIDHELTTFDGYDPSFYTDYNSGFATELYLQSGKFYDIFAAFNLVMIAGNYSGPITMDALNTSTIGISAPSGSFTSQSGAFLGYAKTPAVPEPASWAMLIAGFGLMGSMMRRRPALCSA